MNSTWNQLFKSFKYIPGRNDKRNKPKTMSSTVFVIFVEFDFIVIER